MSEQVRNVVVDGMPPTMPGDRWEWAEKQLAKAVELVRVYGTISAFHGRWAAVRLQKAEADVTYWKAELARLLPKHRLLIDREYAGPGLRLLCSCGKWEARGMQPFSLSETDARVQFQLHAEDGQL